MNQIINIMHMTHKIYNFILKLFYKYDIKILRSNYNICRYDVIINNKDSFIVEFNRKDGDNYSMYIHAYYHKYFKTKMGLFLIKRIISNIIDDFIESRNVKKIILNTNLIDDNFKKILKNKLHKRKPRYSYRNYMFENNVILFN